MTGKVCREATSFNKSGFAGCLTRGDDHFSSS